MSAEPITRTPVQPVSVSFAQPSAQLRSESQVRPRSESQVRPRSESQVRPRSESQVQPSGPAAPAQRDPGPAGEPAQPPYQADLARAAQALLAAELAETPADRFLAAHLAAMRTAVTVLAVRARRRPTSRPVDVWRLLALVAPEYGEWAAFFAAGRHKRLLVQTGAHPLVGEREADDLFRDARTFHDEVSRRLARAWQSRNGAGSRTHKGAS